MVYCQLTDGQKEAYKKFFNSDDYKIVVRGIPLLVWMSPTARLYTSFYTHFLPVMCVALFCYH